MDIRETIFSGIESMFEKKRQQLYSQNLMEDEVRAFVSRNREAIDRKYTYYGCAIREMETKFRVLDDEFSLEYDRNPIESIKTRLKTKESLLRKVRERNIPLSLEEIEANIHDIAGVRIVCSFTEDIYMLADCLLKQDDVRLIEKKDYIENPKPGGYRSLHLIVEVPIFLKEETLPMKVEVQFRTISMDFWASLEHKLRYKKDISEDLARELSQELADIAAVNAQLDQRMQNVKDRIAEAEKDL